MFIFEKIENEDNFFFNGRKIIILLLGVIVDNFLGFTLTGSSMHIIFKHMF